MHLIVDGWVKNQELLTNILSLKSWLREAAEIAGMTPFGEPTVVDFPFPSQEGTALSAVQFLGESSIVVHTYPEHKFIFIDIFSCLNFDASKIIDFVKGSFELGKHSSYLLQRGIDNRGVPYLPKLLNFVKKV